MHDSTSNMANVSGHPGPQSPVIPIPVKSTLSSLARNILITFMRYAGIGVIGTLVHFLILVWLLDFTTPVIASTVGAIAGGITNFQLVRAYVFAIRPDRPFAFPKFATVAIGGIALNAAIMAALSPLFPVLVSQAVATGTVLVAGFSLNRVWSFGEYSR